MARSENVVAEDGQHVEVKYPGESLQDQAKREAYEEGERPVGTSSVPEVADREDKDLREVREIREENERRSHTHNRTELHREIVAGSRTQANKEKPVELHVFGGRAYLNSHGEAVLDHNGVVALQQALAAAFQAVS